MRRILAVLPDPRALARLEAGISALARLHGPRLEVVPAFSLEELSRRVREVDPVAVVLDAAGGDGAAVPGPAGSPPEGARDVQPLPREVTDWLRRHAHLPLVVYARPGLLPRAAIRLGELGVREIVTLDVDDSREAWVRLLLAILSGGVGEDFLGAFPEDLPERIRQFLVASVERARGAVSVGTLSETAIYREASALYRAMSAVGLPPPARLARWGRAYRVIHFAENAGVTLERAALHFGYPSNRCFSNQVKRLTGQAPTSIRERGGAAFLLQLLRDEIAAHRARRGLQECRKP